MQAAVVFGRPWPMATGAWERFPSRLVPFLAESYLDTVSPGSSYLNPQGLEQLLAGGYVRGLGEVILRHSAFRLAGGTVRPATSVPAGDPRLVAAYRLAGQYGAPITVHEEWSFADELERAVQAAPGSTFVWAHAGHGPPEVVRGVLERNANLLADLSARTPWIGPGTVLLQSNGMLMPVWRSLLQDHADRFLTGLDLFAPDHYDLDYVTRMVAYYRALLGQLDPAVARQIAWDNAERVMPVRAG
ncbi:MAG: amidohydrolase family protein [Chloroflexi bacterium]|nr:amidohydrolase family protein [Chloroflexota bacterium]